MTTAPAQESSLTRSAPLSEGGADQGFRVVIAGGGVAALEALLALHEVDDGSLELEMVCPEPAFSLQALSVAEPFGSGPARALDLVGFCREHGATLRRDALAEVWGEQQRVLLASGEDCFYDALLLAFGARRRDALPGALAFRGFADVAWLSSLVGDLERGAVRHLTFAVTPAVRWSLPLYELALMTASRLRGLDGPEVEIRLVTHEPCPLEVFGSATSERLSELLAEAGVELSTGLEATDFDGEILHVANGPDIETRRVVALPELYVPRIPGLPQGARGFIGSDPQMRVGGMRAVWVAGDASWMPIKQGGLAAQQADAACSDIAGQAGLDSAPRPFEPVIRGALLTGEAPRFMRVDLEGPHEGSISESPMWWPPSKVAAPRLAPYLAARWGGGDTGGARLEDLAEPAAAGEAEDEHREAVRLALRFADVDARQGEYDDALRWLDVAERLNVTLPFDYVERRETWRAQADGAARAADGG